MRGTPRPWACRCGACLPPARPMPPRPWRTSWPPGVRPSRRPVCSERAGCCATCAGPACYSAAPFFTRTAMARSKTTPTPVELPEVNFSDWDGVRSLHLGTEWIQGTMLMDAPYDIELEYVQRMMAWLLFTDPAQARGAAGARRTHSKPLGPAGHQVAARVQAAGVAPRLSALAPSGRRPPATALQRLRINLVNRHCGGAPGDRRALYAGGCAAKPGGITGPQPP